MPGRRPSARQSEPARRQHGRPAADTRRSGHASRGHGVDLELTFLPGLGDVLRDEVDEVLHPARHARPAPGRDDALVVRHEGRVSDALRLRTAVAAFVSLHFDVPRPRSLTSGDHLARVVDAVGLSLRSVSSRSFRFEAAGADSAVFTRLASLVSQATGLTHDPVDGELVIRVRRAHRSPGSDVDPGWDVLVRIGPRPLSARPWRVVDYPGAANATIAAAMVRLAGVRAGDRVANLMCGSGTLLVERLLAGPAAAAVAVDVADDAVEAARANLVAAGLEPSDGDGPVRLVTGDALDPAAWTRGGPGYDLLLADPPWGGLHGEHATNEALHAGLLRAAHAASRPGARLLVLTHEVRVMHRCLRDAGHLWQLRDELRVFAKGHHPRVFVLDRV
ncbi:methyltransferase [Cellulomonas alba]|uniref:Methyltransferase n=1 Tax=Cellulomonas alba TaxID=3053467 RepID=A0ABT7SFB4_9CELL|nr:methyltransferase [Cellulomonas alba]MDM7854889.1 methyltransferase [Cellulomonas alba]